MTVRIDITSKVLREKIRLELDPKQSPEAISFLKKTESEDFTSYELATKLAECDKTAVMSQALFDYIVELYLEAIQDNNANAMNDLGALYYDGRGCEQDYSKAVYYCSARQPASAGESGLLLLLRAKCSGGLRKGVSLLCSRRL